MEHWANAVVESISPVPETPPSSPAMLPQLPAETASGPFDLPITQARTIDIELGRVGASSSSTDPPRVSKASATAKTPSCTIDEASPALQPAAWRLHAALLAGLFQQCLSNGLIMTYGPILSYYTNHLLCDVDSTRLSLNGAVPPFFLLALALPIGPLLDTGHHRRLNICAALLITSALLSLAFSTHDSHHSRRQGGRYHAVLLCAVPLGLGQSIFSLSSSHVARTWLPERPGLAMGVVNAGAALGGSVFPVVFTRLTNQQSFQLAMLTLAAVAAVLAGFVVCFAVPHPKNFNAVGSGSCVQSSLSSTDLLSQLSNASLLFFVASICITFAGVLSIPFYIDTWSQLLPARPTVSLVTIMNASQLPGRVFSSLLSDHIRARYLHVTVLLMAALIVPPFWLSLYVKGVSSRLPAAYAFTVLYGMLHGSIVALTANDIQEMIETQDRSEGGYGQLSGVVYTLAAPFMLSGPLVNGRLVDSLGVRAVGVWAAGCFGVGALLMCLSLFAGGLSRQTATAKDRWAYSRREEIGEGLNEELEDVESRKGESWECGRWRVEGASQKVQDSAIP